MRPPPSHNTPPTKVAAPNAPVTLSINYVGSAAPANAVPWFSINFRSANTLAQSINIFPTLGPGTSIPTPQNHPPNIGQIFWCSLCARILFLSRAFGGRNHKYRQGTHNLKGDSLDYLYLYIEIMRNTKVLWYVHSNYCIHHNFHPLSNVNHPLSLYIRRISSFALWLGHNYNNSAGNVLLLTFTFIYSLYLVFVYIWMGFGL